MNGVQNQNYYFNDVQENQGISQQQYGERALPSMSPTPTASMNLKIQHNHQAQLNNLYNSNNQMHGNFASMIASSSQTPQNFNSNYNISQGFPNPSIMYFPEEKYQEQITSGLGGNRFNYQNQSSDPFSQRDLIGIASTAPGSGSSLLPPSNFYQRSIDVYEYERLYLESQRLQRENKELKETVLHQRKEIETSKVNYMMKSGNLENEINQNISKNNVLKGKIKKIKKFMLALCKIIEETDMQEQGQNKSAKISRENLGFVNPGIDNDTDSDNEKLPTLDLLCHQIKKMMNEHLELKMKKIKRSRKSKRYSARSVNNEINESMFNGGISGTESAAGQGRSKSMYNQYNPNQGNLLRKSTTTSVPQANNNNTKNSISSRQPNHQRPIRENSRQPSLEKKGTFSPRKFSGMNLQQFQSVHDRSTKPSLLEEDKQGIIIDSKSTDSTKRQQAKSVGAGSTNNVQDSNSKQNRKGPSIYRPMMWIPNDMSEECTLCKSYFNLFRRRHHCRQCGTLVCYYCSNHYEYVPGYADQRVRVCDACYRDKKRINRLKQRKWSIISSHFAPNNY